MYNVRRFDNVDDIAQAAAEQTIDILKGAISNFGSATWVVAGGSSPLPAYELLAHHFADSLDWSKVTAIMGDERIGPTDGPDNNWHTIERIIHDLPLKKIIPQSDLSAEHAAEHYEMELLRLPKHDNGLPRFDLVWLGVGSDGHTLSLFPNHPSILPTDKLVIPVHESPKPPSDRVSLSFRALQGTVNLMIIVTGAEKSDIVQQSIGQSQNYPVAIAANIVATHEGNVTWLTDSNPPSNN